jgi:prepilin-type N-terminal cleavage/methylation domain-containing protein
VSKRPSGYSLSELLVAVAILGILLSVALPRIHAYRRRAAVIAAADVLRGVFREVRSEAIARGRNVGVRFVNSGTVWKYTLYVDANGNGVTNADIDAAIDRRITGPLPLDTHLAPATIAVPPQKVRDPDGDWMLPTDVPVQFNRSKICSFSPIGSGTPGSIYLSDGVSTFYAARVLGSSGKVRLVRYDSRSGKWVEP